MLFKTVSWKVLSLCLEHPSRKYSFSDFLKLTASGPTNVQKALKELDHLFVCNKVGNKLNYQLNLKNHLVQSLFLTYAWMKIDLFPEPVKSCLNTLIDKLVPEQTVSIYLFGSSIYSKKPNDYDVAVIYQQNKAKLESIWQEIRTDFQENVEVHFMAKKEFSVLFQSGSYRLTSTLQPCLILYDQNFIFNYLGNILPPGKVFLQQQINEIETKLKKCFSLYRSDKEGCKELAESLRADFLRIYIGFKGEIPGSIHQLEKQAGKLGLKAEKNDLWSTLEWMEKKIREIKTAI